MRRNIYVDAAIRTLILFLLSLLICGAIGMLCGCRTCRPQKEYIERTDTLRTHSTDTLRIIDLRVDSVEVRDSVFTLVKGDTVFIREYHFRDRTKKTAGDTYKARTDTLWRDRTVTEYRTETVEVKKPLRWWQTVLICIGAIAVIAPVAFIVSKLTRLRRK